MKCLHCHERQHSSTAIGLAFRKQQRPQLTAVSMPCQARSASTEGLTKMTQGDSLLARVKAALQQHGEQARGSVPGIRAGLGRRHKTGPQQTASNEPAIMRGKQVVPQLASGIALLCSLSRRPPHLTCKVGH